MNQVYMKHIKAGKDEADANKKLMDYRLKLAIEFIFNRFVVYLNNTQTGQLSITQFAVVIPSNKNKELNLLK